MSSSVRDSIYDAIASIRLIDPHTHINPHAPASNTLADLLGYHYYTELAHSAGMPKDDIEGPGLEPRALVGRLVSNLSPIENTAQYRWLVEICRMFFGFDGDRIDTSNWEDVYDSAERQMGMAEWPQMVLDQSNVEAVFLTNDFDDELSGFDSDIYIPCLRTDDLVFHLAKIETRQRLAGCSGIELDGSLQSLRASLKQRFEHFVGRGARACAISLPPSFQPERVSDGRATTALNDVLRNGPQSDPAHQAALSRRVFWTLAELCDEYGLPFDLMIGVNRGVYQGGVFQGQDLYDSRVSLIQYAELFNAFPDVKFPISVLASVTNQELVSYAWIFPNVITNGHWWYSNTPSFIARDAAARLEAVPQTKQIAYYSDAYKLEFVWPKFDMYRRVLAGILADHFVGQNGWSEERAIELGRQVLRDNVDEIFPRPARAELSTGGQVDPLADTWDDLGDAEPETLSISNQEPAGWGDPAEAGTSAALAAGAIGMVEVNEVAETPAETPTEQSDDTLGVAQADDSGETNQQGDTGYSTLILDDSADQPASGDMEEQAVAETIDFSQDDVPAADSEVIEDTVRIETVVEEPLETLELSPTEVTEDASPEIDETLEDVSSQFTGEQANLDLDPLPSSDEIQAADVDDVELLDFSSPPPDAASIEAEVDAEPLDVGNLLDDDDVPQETGGDEIRMLRGEESFQPDEDSLQLQPDPMTGELTFPVPGADQPADQPIEHPTSDPMETLALETEQGGQVETSEPDDWTGDDLILDTLEETIEHVDTEADAPMIDEDAGVEIDLDEMASESDEKNDYLNP